MKLLLHTFLTVSILCTGLSAQVADSLHPKELIPVSDSVTIPVLDFKNTDVRDVLRALGMQYNVNLYLEPEVQGALSLYLTEIKVADAIDFIAKRMNLVYTVESGVVKIHKYREPEPPPPPEPEVVFSNRGGSLDIDVSDMTPRSVAGLFIDSAGMNVIVEGNPTKTITGRLKDVPPERAVKILFESNGYQVSVSDGIHYVGLASWGDDNQGGASRMRRLSITINDDRRVTMEVNDASLDEVVRTIVVQSGMNIFIYDKITGTISAKCDSVPIDDALRFLLQNTKFNFWKDRGIYFLGSREMSQQKTTLVVPLRHIRAEEEQVGKLLPPVITRDAVVKYDSEHNSVVLIGSFDVVAHAQEFLERIDRPIPQVLIEALVVDFNVDKMREFGVSAFTGGGRDSSGYWRSERYLPELDLKPGREKTAEALSKVLRFLGLNRVVKLPEGFRASIHALETANVVKVHSTPQIATINGNPASITIGETRYYKLTKEVKTPTGTGENLVGTDERFEVLRFNTELQVTPWVMDSGYVMVEIRPEFNIPRSGGDPSRPPDVDTRVLESMVRLRDGQTIVLGGQRQTEQVVRGSGVPFLSSIPILGWLFSNKRFAKVETQMMIFLTPHVYYGSENAVQPDDYFGDEINRMMDRHDPDRFRNRLERRREERRRRKEAKERLERMRGEPEKTRGFTWPWKRATKEDVKALVDTTGSTEENGSTAELSEDSAVNKAVKD